MLTRSIVTTLAACALFIDGTAALKGKLGNTARRKQQRATNIVQETQTGHHLHARQINGTSNSTTPKRFYNNASASEFRSWSDLSWHG